MSAQDQAQGAAYGSWQRGSCGTFRGWHALEIVAMVAGFALWWPLGLAVLGLKFAQRKGYPVPDLAGMARSRFSGFAAGFKSDERRRWRPFEQTSGNAAFDEWRKTELEKLEEQRRKLDAAESEFAAHMDNLRRARDREEFDRFMAARHGSPQN